MSFRSLMVAASIAAAGSMFATAAEAAPGVATGNVNMRTCASVQCARITTIPVGARVEVLSCAGWCELLFAGYHGFASARYIQVGYYQQQPPPPPVYQRTPMPPQMYWYYGRPWWDQRNRTWYDGRRWWYDGRWHRRPPNQGFTFEFRF